MGLLDRIMRQDAMVLLHTFGEEVVYYPGGDLTQGRTILAVVDRLPPRPVDAKAPKGRDVGYGLTVTVANDPDRGIDARTWNQQLDTVGLAPAGPGGTVEVRKFVRHPLSVDAGMLKLGII